MAYGAILRKRELSRPLCLHCTRVRTERQRCPNLPQPLLPTASLPLQRIGSRPISAAVPYHLNCLHIALSRVWTPAGADALRRLRPAKAGLRTLRRLRRRRAVVGKPPPPPGATPFLGGRPQAASLVRGLRPRNAPVQNQSRRGASVCVIAPITPRQPITRRQHQLSVASAQ